MAVSLSDQPQPKTYLDNLLTKACGDFSELAVVRNEFSFTSIKSVRDVVTKPETKIVEDIISNN